MSAEVARGPARPRRAADIDRVPEGPGVRLEPRHVHPVVVEVLRGGQTTIRRVIRLIGHLKEYGALGGRMPNDPLLPLVRPWLRAARQLTTRVRRQTNQRNRAEVVDRGKRTIKRSSRLSAAQISRTVEHLETDDTNTNCPRVAERNRIVGDGTTVHIPRPDLGAVDKISAVEHGIPCSLGGCRAQRSLASTIRYFADNDPGDDQDHHDDQDHTEERHRLRYAGTSRGS